MKPDVVERSGLSTLTYLETLVELVPGSLKLHQLGVSRVSGLESPGCLLDVAKDVPMKAERLATLESPVALEHRQFGQRDPCRDLAARIDELDDDGPIAHTPRLRPLGVRVVAPTPAPHAP